jgi:hypothetical protein
MGSYMEKFLASYILQGELWNPEYPQKIGNENLEPVLRPDALGIPVDIPYGDSCRGV